MTGAATTLAGTGPVYRLRGVERVYGRGDARVHALDGIDLEIAAGEFVVVAGASGSGKTTLLQLLGALDRPTAGEIAFDGRDLTALGPRELTRIRRRELGFVFQQFNLIPTLRARENVEAAAAPLRLASAERRARAVELLERVGLGRRTRHLPDQLSGGEQQRVAIARALVNAPRVVLADEPTGNLDSRTGREVLALLRELSGDGGRTMVLISHDPEIAAGAGRLIRLRDGRVEDAPPA
jgi:ABC-type lipoprotein export system ATPase subunit